jgi:tetratricopeptide (TPR) repeat protein
MTNRDNNPERPVSKYQDFLDASLGTDITQAMENRHAVRVLEAIDCLEKGNYAEATALFLMTSNIAPTEVGKQYCKILAKGANDSYNAYEKALANSASEIRAKETAKVLWNTLSKELSEYLNFLGVYFSERKKYLEAIQYYDRAIKTNPSYAMAYFSRGGTKADLHLYDEAIQDLEIAEQLFQEQGNLANYQNARKFLAQMNALKSSSNQKEAPNNTKPRSVTTEQAMKIVEAQIYSLNNPYLSPEEKLEVARWYSLPTELMTYTFLATAIYTTNQPLSWFYLLGIPLAVNLVSGLRASLKIDLDRTKVLRNWDRYIL